MNTITPEQLQKLLIKNPRFSLLDVRSSDEFNQVRVPRSFNIPLDQLNPNDLFKRKYWSKHHIVYLFCRSGLRAYDAFKLFNKHNFSGAVVVAGGISAWIKAGFKVEENSPKNVSIKYQVRSLVLTFQRVFLVLNNKFF